MFDSSTEGACSAEHILGRLVPLFFLGRAACLVLLLVEGAARRIPSYLVVGEYSRKFTRLNSNTYI